MTIQAPNWYREIIRSQVRARYQSMGGYLDGTMSRGDGGAGTIKFPRIGRVDSYELLGSIQDVPATNPDMDTISVSVRDFEASAWMRVQDARRQGPNEQAAVAKMLYGAIRRRRDNLKLEALQAFAGTTSATGMVGDGSAVIDILDILEAKDQILGSGAEDDVWWVIPHAWFSQLMMYDEFADADYVGPDLPFKMSSKIRKKTWLDMQILGIPDEHHIYGTGAWGTGGDGGYDTSGYTDTFMWAADAVGFEMEWDQESMSLSSHPEKEGTPMLGKVGLSGAAVGILPEGVKRLRMKSVKRPARPT